VELFLRIWVIYVGLPLLAGMFWVNFKCNYKLTKLLRTRHAPLWRSLDSPVAFNFPPAPNFRYLHWVMFGGWRQSKDPEVVSVAGSLFLAQHGFALLLILWVPSMLIFWHYFGH
jgi:hypothetical protein